MHRIKNRKFLAIVDNLKNTKNKKIDVIDSIQILDNYILNSIYKKNNTKSLLNLFNSENKIDRFSNNGNKFSNKSLISKNFIENKTTNNVILNTNFNISYLKLIKKHINDVQFIYSPKKGDYYSDIFFI